MERSQENSRRFIHLKTAKNLRAQELYCLPEVLGFKEKLLYGAVGAAGWLGLTYIFYHDFLIGFIFSFDGLENHCMKSKYSVSDANFKN